MAAWELFASIVPCIIEYLLLCLTERRVILRVYHLPGSIKNDIHHIAFSLGLQSGLIVGEHGNCRCYQTSFWFSGLPFRQSTVSRLGQARSSFELRCRHCVPFQERWNQPIAHYFNILPWKHILLQNNDDFSSAKALFTSNIQLLNRIANYLWQLASTFSYFPIFSDYLCQIHCELSTPRYTALNHICIKWMPYGRKLLHWGHRRPAE